MKRETEGDIEFRKETFNLQIKNHISLIQLLLYHMYTTGQKCEIIKDNCFERSLIKYTIKTLKF